ncbi:putative NAD(P)-binding-domain-containing protein, partial [Hyaloraphidium curvatum]
VSGGASLLVAYNLAGKSVLVVGGSATAASRVFAALEADAGHVTVVAPADELCAELAARARAKEVTHIPRDFDEAKDLAAADDIKGVVFVALEDSVRSKQVAMACRKRKIPVHCSGFPEYSDFFLTATFRDHSLQISVSSGGNGPTLANRVRNHIAATLPPSVGKAMQRLSVLRQK